MSDRSDILHELVIRKGDVVERLSPDGDVLGAGVVTAVRDGSVIFEDPVCGIRGFSLALLGGQWPSWRIPSSRDEARLREDVARYEPDLRKMAEDDQR